MDYKASVCLGAPRKFNFQIGNYPWIRKLNFGFRVGRCCEMVKKTISIKFVSEVRLNYFWRVLVIGALLFVVERLIEPILPPRCFLAAQQAVVNPSRNL